MTGILPDKNPGLKQIDLEITQLLDLWVNGGEKNNGVLLISHRRSQQKALQNGKVALALQFRKAVVTIFYTDTE